MSVLDLSEVDSLGGGTAQLLNTFDAERDARQGCTHVLRRRVTDRTQLSCVAILNRQSDSCSRVCRKPSPRRGPPERRRRAFPMVRSDDALDGTLGGGPSGTPSGGPEMSPQFVEDARLGCFLEGQVSLSRDMPDEEESARRASMSALQREQAWGTRAHVLSLQADGNFHPVTHGPASTWSAAFRLTAR